MSLEPMKNNMLVIVVPMLLFLLLSCSTTTSSKAPAFIEKDVDIRIIINRESIPDDWSITSLRADLRTVRIRAPETVLEKLSYINTSAITVAKPTGRSARMVQTVKLAEVPGVVSVDPPTVEISIGLIKDNEFREFKQRN